tara:strand:+ start:224 stop:463 length:240 start_codon:yes stop_codon:yes gene_type:complete
LIANALTKNWPVKLTHLIYQRPLKMVYIKSTTLMRIMILAIQGKFIAFWGNEIGTIPKSIMNFTIIYYINYMDFTRIDS